MKLKKALSESMITFKKIDESVSKLFLYYAAAGGFILGWVSLGIILFLISGALPEQFILLLRVFYFLLSFLLGIKFTIFVIESFKKYTS